MGTSITDKKIKTLVNSHFDVFEGKIYFRNRVLEDGDTVKLQGRDHTINDLLAIAGKRLTTDEKGQRDWQNLDDNRPRLREHAYQESVQMVMENLVR